MVSVVEGLDANVLMRVFVGTFSIPITKYPQPDGPNVYHIPTNDHDGENVSEAEVTSYRDRSYCRSRYTAWWHLRLG